jgi:signal transduction histidine kinase
MKLQHRLFLFSTTQLVVFGGLFVVAYALFGRSVIPAFRDLLNTKSEQVIKLSSLELDVPLAAEDMPMIDKAVATIADDPDLVFIRVRDATGGVLLERGARPAGDVFAGQPVVAHDDELGIRTWTDISVEGVKVGSVAVVFGTGRLDAMEAWAHRVTFVVALLWIAALVYSALFSRSLVRPVRAMMNFSRMVAGGGLTERLVVPAPGELRELRDYLNDMSAELEHRERERQLAALKTEAMQRELLGVSRMAGMAEIATGVLHNVGNVLNSLNVSVSLIGEQLRASKVGGLSKAIELFERHPGGLRAFLDTDKGKVLPGYLASLGTRLADENAKTLEELASVTRNIEHIKSIVAMQQSYARPAGIIDTVQISALIDDALRMGESSFARHGIDVIRDYAGEVTLTTDRHKLLQIMINLISNARHALKDSGRAPQQLTVGVREVEERVVITVKDTGVGIPAANLDKIFQHGFTTKKGGHGFGLHSSANAARELRGTLCAASDGPGRGATFTLELPRSSPEGTT